MHTPTERKETCKNVFLSKPHVYLLLLNIVRIEFELFRGNFSLLYPLVQRRYNSLVKNDFLSPIPDHSELHAQVPAKGPHHQEEGPHRLTAQPQV